MEMMAIYFLFIFYLSTNSINILVFKIFPEQENIVYKSKIQWKPL